MNDVILPDTWRIWRTSRADGVLTSKLSWETWKQLKIW